MERQLSIQTEPIAIGHLAEATAAGEASGAVVHFLGYVRSGEEGRRIRGLHYECFEKMAAHQFHLLFDEVARRWPVQRVRLVHRVGHVAVGEPSLWVEIITPHRAEAFAACQYLIDQMKEKVPIWKKPEWEEAPGGAAPELGGGGENRG